METRGGGRKAKEDGARRKKGEEGKHLSRKNGRARLKRERKRKIMTAEFANPKGIRGDESRIEKRNSGDGDKRQVGRVGKRWDWEKKKGGKEEQNCNICKGLNPKSDSEAQSVAKALRK